MHNRWLKYGKDLGTPPTHTHPQKCFSIGPQSWRHTGLISTPLHHNPHPLFESRLSTGRGRLFFGQMACCSPPPSFSSPRRQQKGSQQPIRFAEGGFLPVISDEVRYAQGIYYGDRNRRSLPRTHRVREPTGSSVCCFSAKTSVVGN